VNEGSAVVVTGATGVVGAPLADALAARGRSVYAMSRSPVKEKASLTWIRDDLEQPGSDPPRCETLFHTAPIWLLPDNLERFARSGVGRVVAFSSTSSTTKSDSGDIAERRLAERLRQGELQALEQSRRLGIDCTILRPTMIYGLGRDRNITQIARVINKLHFFLVANGANGRRQPVHVCDLVDACVGAEANTGTYGRIYVLAGGEVLTYRQMVGRIFSGLGLRERLYSLPVPVYAQLVRCLGLFPGFPRYSPYMANRMNEDLYFDDREARRDLKYRPRVFLQDPRLDLPMLVH